jgi:hypothetical protein
VNVLALNEESLSSLVADEPAAGLTLGEKNFLMSSRFGVSGSFFVPGSF